MICLLSLNGFAQIPVTDAAAGGQLTALNTSAIKAAGDRATALTKAAATLQQLSELKKQYDKTVDMVESISDYVKTSKQVINMKNSLSDITSEYSRGITYIYSDKNITADDRIVFSNVYSKMVGRALDDFEYGTKIITDGDLKMNDAERLTILSEVESKMTKNRNMIKYLNSSIKRAVAQKMKGKNQQQFIQQNKNSFNQIKD